MRLALYIVACLAGLIVALLGSEPPLALAVIAIVIYPVSAWSVARSEDRPRRSGPPSMLPAMLVGLAGTLLVVVLARLAADAPSWVDALSADCGGPSTGTQQIALVFASIAFIIAAVPEAVTVAAVGLRLKKSPGPALPLTLNFFPVAVAVAGIALIVASYLTSC